MPAGVPVNPVRRPPSGVVVRFTDRSCGDLAGSGPGVDSRRASVVDLPWTWLRQVHGAEVVVVDGPGAGRGAEADAAVTAAPGIALAVLTADCAPLALWSPEGVTGVVHAGWRGLLAGVVEQAVAVMRRLGASDVSAVLGPCIRPACYPFGAADLELVARRLGPAVRAVDSDGHPALDLPAAVRVAVDRAGADLAGDDGTCTACSTLHWSWRARRDTARQAVVVWRT